MHIERRWHAPIKDNNNSNNMLCAYVHCIVIFPNENSCNTMQAAQQGLSKASQQRLWQHQRRPTSRSPPTVPANCCGARKCDQVYCSAL